MAIWRRIVENLFPVIRLLELKTADCFHEILYGAIVCMVILRLLYEFVLCVKYCFYLILDILMNGLYIHKAIGFCVKKKADIGLGK